jgi:hypothetical protein
MDMRLLRLLSVSIMLSLTIAPVMLTPVAFAADGDPGKNKGK